MTVGRGERGGTGERDWRANERDKFRAGLDGGEAVVEEGMHWMLAWERRGDFVGDRRSEGTEGRSHFGGDNCFAEDTRIAEDSHFGEDKRSSGRWDMLQ
jgi:hypothetical protein